jgi:hypothetical protein
MSDTTSIETQTYQTPEPEPPPSARRAFSSLRPVKEPVSLPDWLKQIDARLARIERVLGIEP